MGVRGVARSARGRGGARHTARARNARRPARHGGQAPQPRPQPQELRQLGQARQLRWLRQPRRQGQGAAAATRTARRPFFFFLPVRSPWPGGRGGAAGGQAGAARAPRGGPHEARERACVSPLRARGARRRVGGPLRSAERCPLRARSPFLGILVPAHGVGEARARCPRRRASYGGAERMRGRHEPRAGKFPPSPSPARLTAATRERRRDRASLRRCPRV